MRLSIKKATADSVSRWLQKYLDTTNILQYPKEEFARFDFFCLRTLSKVILAGDFNSPGIDWRNGCLTDSYVSGSFREFLIDISSDYFLEQIVLEPTRGRNLLDLCFTIPIQTKLRSVIHYLASVIMRQ